MRDFKKRTIIVTVAAGNLGATISAHLAKLGANLVLADTRAPALEELGTALGVTNLQIAGADVRTREGCERIMAEAMERFGRIDGLANTVGTFRVKHATELASDDWAFLMDLNALSALRLSEAALPVMRKAGYGRIVHVAAGAGKRAFASASVYSASKAAVMRIAEAVSEENKAAGITCNTVMPGTIDTPQNRSANADADFTTWVKPGEIAAVIAFLLSEAGGAVTGASIPVTGRG